MADDKKCSGCECCAKTCLIIVNILFQVIGFVLLALGIILKVGYSLIDQYLLPLVTGSTSDTTTSSTSSSLSSVLDSLPDLLAVAAWVFIGLGLLMLVAGLLGCIGACCKIRTLLIVYIVIVAVLLLVKLVFIILVATAVLNDELKTSLKSTITSSYGGIVDTSPVSLALNILMIKYTCCGVDSYQDFTDATGWNRTYQYEDGGVTKTVTLVTPVTCCKMDGTFPDVTPIDYKCLDLPDDAISNWNTGCWSSLSAEINNYKTIVIGSYSAILLFEAICIAVAAYLIARTVKDEKEGKANPWTDD